MAAHHFQAAHDRTAEGCRELDFELERRRICGIRGFSTRRSLLGLWASDAWHRQRILRWSLTSVFTSTPVRSSLTSSCLHDVIHLRDAYASIYFAFHYCLLAFFIARITISILLPPSHYPCSHPCPHRRLSFVFISPRPPPSPPLNITSANPSLHLLYLSSSLSPYILIRFVCLRSAARSCDPAISLVIVHIFALLHRHTFSFVFVSLRSAIHPRDPPHSP